jgi:type II secretory pathway pseudopilin PulG
MHLKQTKPLGFTLIEILIATGISSMLIFGMMKVFSAAQQTYLRTQGMEDLRQNAQFLFDHLNDVVGNAGYMAPPNGISHWKGYLAAFPAITSPVTLPKGAYIGAPSGGTGLVISMQGDGVTIKDCNGTIVPTNTVYINYYTISSNNLICGRYTTSGSLSPASVTIANNVEKMNVLLGENVYGDGLDNQQGEGYVGPSRYIAWSGTNDATIDHPNIMSVRIGLLLRSTQSNIAAQADTNTYNLLHPDGRNVVTTYGLNSVNIKVTEPGTDSALRMVVQFVIPMRQYFPKPYPKHCESAENIYIITGGPIDPALGRAGYGIRNCLQPIAWPWFPWSSPYSYANCSAMGNLIYAIPCTDSALNGMFGPAEW